MNVGAQSIASPFNDLSRTQFQVKILKHHARQIVQMIDIQAQFSGDGYYAKA
jgi:hypothetical protein